MSAIYKANYSIKNQDGGLLSDHESIDIEFYTFGEILEFIDSGLWGDLINAFTYERQIDFNSPSELVDRDDIEILVFKEIQGNDTIYYDVNIEREEY